MSDSIKYFTLDEANKTLPLVSKVVTDIVESYGEWRDRVQRYEVITGSAGGLEETPEQQQVREEIDEIARRINGYIGELEQIGCVLKGFDDGLVDFYSKHDGRDIFLCWRHGESEVSYWHELDAGFAGRRPITPELIESDVS